MSKRRSNGEGSIRKLASGIWYSQIMDGYTQDGKRNLVSFSAPSKGEVLDLIRAYQNQKDEHLNINKNLLVCQWADTWYADYKSQVQPSTYSNYKYTLDIIKRALGGKKVCEVIPMHINAFMDELLERGYSLSQIRKCRTMLIQIFDAADSNGLVLRNPARKAKLIKDLDGSLSAPRRQKDAFTEKEVEILMRELAHDLMGISIRTMLSTGLRGQEVLALTPKDIAEDGSSITISKAVKMVEDRATLGPPKSKTSYRTVPVPEDAREYVRKLREIGGKDYIWHQPGCNPLYAVPAFRRRYYNAIKQIAGVRKLSPHCCRHTYITRLQEKGVPMEIIARLAGHANISTTDGYTHTSESTLAKAVAVLNSRRQEEASE